MSSCSLFASGLVSEISGAVPTFSYRETGHNGDYFGVQMTYLRGTSTCYQTGALPRFTPVIQNEAEGFSVDCVFQTQGTTYTGIFCPRAPVTEIPDGVLTVSYKNWNQGQPTPIPFFATFGPSPAPKTVTATANVVATSTSTSTATVSPGFASTATVYSAGTTQTQTNTIVVTQTQVTAKTIYVSSCSSSSPISATSQSSASGQSSSSSPISSAGSSTSSTSLSSTLSQNSLSSRSASASAISSAVSTGSATAPISPVATSSVVCPGSNGQIINTSAGTFVVECGIDHAGGDMSGSPVYPGSYEGCIAACASRSGCVDVSYIPGGPCYLKSAIGTANQYPGIVGGKLLGGARSTSTISSSGTGISTTEIPASTSFTSSVAPSGTGSPTRTVTVTTTISGTGYQCACKPTSSLGSGSAALTCPSSDGQTFTSDCGATYAIECYADRYGDDIPGGSSLAYTLDECIADCDRTNGCVDVSYVIGSPGICYKKSSIAEIRQNNNIYGARLLTGCTTNTRLKLHRKSVVRAPAVHKKHIQKRGVYGPDFTYTQESPITLTKTSTATSVVYNTVTVTPANSGTTTKTVYTTATRTATITNGATATQTQQISVTTCPAITKRAML